MLFSMGLQGDPAPSAVGLMRHTLAKVHLRLLPMCGVRSGGGFGRRNGSKLAARSVWRIKIFAAAGGACQKPAAVSSHVRGGASNQSASWAPQIRLRLNLRSHFTGDLNCYGIGAYLFSLRW